MDMTEKTLTSQEINKGRIIRVRRDEVLYLYLARGLHYGETHPDDDEFLSLERMPLAELVEHCMSGEITDAKTVCAALKAKNLCL